MRYYALERPDPVDGAPQRAFIVGELVAYVIHDGEEERATRIPVSLAPFVMICTRDELLSFSDGRQALADWEQGDDSRFEAREAREHERMLRDEGEHDAGIERLKKMTPAERIAEFTALKVGDGLRPERAREVAEEIEAKHWSGLRLGHLRSV
jgi:hypothetical protein